MYGGIFSVCSSTGPITIIIIINSPCFDISKMLLHICDVHDKCFYLVYTFYMNLTAQIFNIHWLIRHQFQQIHLLFFELILSFIKVSNFTFSTQYVL